MSTFISWQGTARITFIEMIDQSNGNGGYVSWINGGIGHRSVTIFLRAIDLHIDYIVRIYAEPLEVNDFFIGNLTSISELAYT